MKLIIKDGMVSRNTPSSSEKALCLALHTSYVDGVATNVYLTKDDELVIYQKDNIENNPIKEQTLSSLQLFNLGSRVKPHFLISLKRALEIFKTTKKKLILNVVDHGSKNSKYISKLLTLTNHYPEVNLYLKSSNQQLVEQLNKKKNKQKVGAVITTYDSPFWLLSLDFYSLNTTNVDIKEALNQLAIGKILMVENIDSKEELNHIHHYYGCYSHSVYVISPLSFIISRYFHKEL